MKNKNFISNSSKIIPTQQAYYYLIQLDLPGVIWEWDLYFDKSNEHKFLKGAILPIFLT